jgi:TrmH family RNA methyltransferase
VTWGVECMVAPITSTANQRVKAIRALRLRKYRERAKRFWVEGIHIVHEALATSAKVDLLVYAPELLTSDLARELVAQALPGRRLAVSAQVFDTLSSREGPQGLGAVVRIVDPALSDVPLDQDLLLVVAHQVRGPGNLGTIIRTADCVAASAVVTVEPSADPYDPQAVRASMGSLFSLPLVRLSDEAELWQWSWEAKSMGWPLQVIATSSHGTDDYRALDLRKPTVVLLGSEGPGLPESARAQADFLARIPLRGRASSLNVGAAAAVLLYEVLNQRGRSAEELNLQSGNVRGTDAQRD